MILADSWYADHIHGAIRLVDRVPARYRRLAEKSGLFRGLMILTAGRQASVVVMTNAAPGATLCKIAYGLLGQRKLVLLEYIVHQPRRHDYLRRVWFHVVRRWLLGRALLRAHVLTAHEASTLPAAHNIPPHCFEFVRWPGRFDDTPLNELSNGKRVVATGRRTDWQTFFAAADGTDWEISVVCTASDLAIVERLATAATAVRHDISAEEHQREVERAVVYVIAVPETSASIGQIRVMNATQAGVPIVASDVSGLRGYLDKSCAVLVPPANPIVLRDAVTKLLGDSQRREELRNAARDRDGTMNDYLDRINALVAAALVGS